MSKDTISSALNCSKVDHTNHLSGVPSIRQSQFVSSNNSSFSASLEMCTCLLIKVHMERLADCPRTQSNTIGSALIQDVQALRKRKHPETIGWNLMCMLKCTYRTLICLWTYSCTLVYTCRHQEYFWHGTYKDFAWKQASTHPCRTAMISADHWHTEQTTPLAPLQNELWSVPDGRMLHCPRGHWPDLHASATKSVHRKQSAQDVCCWSMSIHPQTLQVCHHRLKARPEDVTIQTCLEERFFLLV